MQLTKLFVFYFVLKHCTEDDGNKIMCVIFDIKRKHLCSHFDFIWQWWHKKFYVYYVIATAHFFFLSLSSFSAGTAFFLLDWDEMSCSHVPANVFTRSIYFSFSLAPLKSNLVFYKSCFSFPLFLSRFISIIFTWTGVFELQQLLHFIFFLIYQCNPYFTCLYGAT